MIYLMISKTPEMSIGERLSHPALVCSAGGAALALDGWRSSACVQGMVRQILGAILGELKDNRTALAARRERMPQERSIPLGLRWKDALWRAFSDGGELRWIADLTLLESIAAAYHQIRSVAFVEEEMVRQTGALTVPMGTAHGADVGEGFKSELMAVDMELEQAIERAIGALVDRIETE